MTVSEEIIKVLDAICAKFGIVVDWTASNVLPYLSELCGKFITYEIATSVVWIVLAAIGFFVLYKFAKKMYDFDKDTFECFVPVPVIAGILLIVCLIGQTFDIVTCVTFPEKMVIERAVEYYDNLK